MEGADYINSEYLLGRSICVFLILHKHICCGYSLEVPTTYDFMEKLRKLSQNHQIHLLNLFIHADQYRRLWKMQSQMRRLVMSRLIGIYTVCNCVIDFWVNPYLQQWMCPNSEMERSISETQGWKCYYTSPLTSFILHYCIINKSAASTAPCPAIPLTSSMCHNSVKMKCVLHALPLYIFTIFTRLNENIWNRFQVIGRTHVYDLDHYWQCSKGDNSKSKKFRVMVLIFCKLYYGDIHLYKVSRKYLEEFSSYRVNANILQKSIFAKFKGPKAV